MPMRRLKSFSSASTRARALALLSTDCNDRNKELLRIDVVGGLGNPVCLGTTFLFRRAFPD